MAQQVIDWGEKDPNEVIKCGIRFGRALAAGDSLATAVWAFIDQAGLTKTGEMVDPTDNTAARVTLSAGTAGLNGKLLVTVTTAQGETLEGVAKIKVRNSV